MADGLGDTEVFFSRWVKRTEEILVGQLAAKKIGVTDDLKRSVQSRMITMADGYLRGEFMFMERGRFVDMGAGRGSNTDRSLYDMDDAYTNRKKRKPKKWYSRPFYGRLNDLEGAIGYAIMEQAIDEVKRPLKEV